MVIRRIGNLLIVCMLLAVCLGACTSGEEVFMVSQTGDTDLREADRRDGGEPLSLESAGDPSLESPETDRFIYVHVCGAVVSPGVYRLPEGSRGDAALELAGGFTEEAAINSVNLAAVLGDGEKLYFPEKQEAVAEGASGAQEGRVNINRASLEELCTLPGIGAARAADIINYREQQGRYETCEDIMRVSGIKQSVYQKLKDKIRTD